MPNLNLNEDPRRKLRQQPLSPFNRPPITGGGSKMLPLMVLFGLLIFVGVILFLLNQSGYIHLWGEKSERKEKMVITEVTPVETPSTPQESITNQPEVKKEIIEPPAINKTAEDQKIKTTIQNEEVKKPKEQKPVIERQKENIKKDNQKFVQRNESLKLGNYTIFIGSYRDRKRAEAEAQRWSEAGFEVAISEKSFTSGNGKWYRVHIGNFSTREDAVKTAMKLADGFEGGYWIDVVK